MVPTRLAIVAGIASLLFSSQLYALGLGEIALHSEYGENLSASIPLSDVDDLAVDKVNAGLASKDDFELVGLGMARELDQLIFEVDLTEPDAPIISITTDAPLPNHYIDLLIDVQWPSGRLLREYSLNLKKVIFLEEKPSISVISAGTEEEPDIPEASSDVSGFQVNSGQVQRSDEPVTETSVTELSPEPTESPEPISPEATEVIEEEEPDVSEPEPSEPEPSQPELPAPETSTIEPEAPQTTAAEKKILPVEVIEVAQQQTSRTEPTQVPATRIEPVESIPAENEVNEEVEPDQTPLDSVVNQPIDDEQSDQTTSTTRYQVQSGDTLWGIAARMAASGSMQERMNTVFRLNRNAFINNDINMLKAGAQLQLPANTAALVAENTTGDDVIRDDSQENNIENRPANALPAQSDQINASNDKPLLSLTAGQEQTKLVKSDDGGGYIRTVSRREYDSMEEELARSAREKQELASAVTGLNEQLNTMQALIELQSQELEQLRSSITEQSQANQPPKESDSGSGWLFYLIAFVVSVVIAGGYLWFRPRQEADTGFHVSED